MYSDQCDKECDKFNNIINEKFDVIFNEKFAGKFDEHFKDIFIGKFNDSFDRLFFELFSEIFDEIFKNKFDDIFFVIFNRIFNEKFSQIFNEKFNEMFSNGFNAKFNGKLINVITQKLEDHFGNNFDEKLKEKLIEKFNNCKLIEKLSAEIENKLNEKFSEKLEECFEDKFDEDFNDEFSYKFNDRLNDRLNSKLNCAIGTSGANMFETGLEKHQKYKSHYGINEIFYGIGVENEVYLEFENGIDVKKANFLNNRKRERYSVDYNTNYNQEKIANFLKLYADKYGDTIKVPLLINSHSFTHTDCENNPKTLYTKLCEPNPKFLGQTLIDKISETNEYLKSQRDMSYTFDGDTIEFMTLDFYNTNINNVISELKSHKSNFLDNLNDSFRKNNIFSQYGKVNIMSNNYPFATYMTNIKNVNMFNNGTYHINITLPTLLNKFGKVVNPEKFAKQHKDYIKYIQFMEPLLISVFGSPDVFSKIDTESVVSSSSQRCTVSRYIGVGTYDTDKMITGKILSIDIAELECSKNDYWWYNKFHQNSAYVKLDKIGLDINFNKHFNHGIEIRFFDHITDDDTLKNVLKFLIYLADFILDKEKSDIVANVPNPIYDMEWNNVTEKCMRYGSSFALNESSVNMYSKIFGFQIKSSVVSNIYTEIYHNLGGLYSRNGKLSRRTIA